MNEKEKELEQQFKRVKEFPAFRPIPVFEMFISAFSISVTLMLFWQPTMLHDHTVAGASGLYSTLLKIMPQHMWAIAFAFASLLKSFGLLLEFDSLRYLGLLMSLTLYSIISAVFILEAPNIGMLTFTCMAIFTLVSFFVVKHTSIRTNSNNNKEGQ